MTEEKKFVPQQPRLIICEGKSDQEFFKELIATRGLAGIEAVSAAPTSGWTGFANTLKALEFSEMVIAQTLKLIIMVGDHDDKDSFKNICKQVGKAGYNRPTEPKRFVATLGKPAISIVLVPEKSPGCLETLCVDAAYAKWAQLQNPLEQFLTHTEVPHWIKTKQDKARIECLIAATAEPRPYVSFPDHWQLDPQFRIPVNHVVFNPIVDFLTSPEVQAYA